MAVSRCRHVGILDLLINFKMSHIYAHVVDRDSVSQTKSLRQKSGYASG